MGCSFFAFTDCRQRSWVTGGEVGGTPLSWHAHISLELMIEREIGRSGGINKFKINNCRLTRVYFQRNSGGQEDHGRRNPSKGNGGEHHWNCYRRHRLSVREDDREAIIYSPSPPQRHSRVPPIATAGSAYWMKETLRSQQYLLDTPQVGLAATLSAAPRVPLHSLCHDGGIEAKATEEPDSNRPQKRAP